MNAVEYRRAVFEFKWVQHFCNRPCQLAHQQLPERSRHAVARQSLGDRGRKLINRGFVQSY